MANPNQNRSKVKLAIFGAVVVLALVLIIGLVVHRSLNRDRICPNRNQLYYEDPETHDGECLPSKIKGPCGTNMILAADKRNGSKGVGVCMCDVTNDRTMVYHEDTKQCYFIFTQAYCADGEWLTVLKDKGPTCDIRLCDPPEEHGLSELVPLRDGRCVELGKYDNVTCNKSQVIRFFHRKIYPACTYLGTTIGSIGVPGHDCPNGYYSTGAGHCQPDFDFD